MKQNTKRALSLLTALSLILTLLAGCSSKAEAATMRLKRTEGTVGVSDGAGKDLEPAENLGLYSGYGVDTKGSSYAWIDLDEVKLTKMDENSQVEIKKEDKHLTIEVKSGSLFFNITEPLAEDETLDIRTSTMLVGIRGTCGWVEVLDEEHMNVYLLEGKVECTAGENTATVNAGEMAEMSADGMIEVSAFSGSAVPAFVREEVEDNGDLIDAILDASGISVPAYSMASYEELLSTMENVVYSEMIDFEQDGSPELLVITMDFERNTAADVGSSGIAIYRNGPDGPVCLGAGGANMQRRGTYSLVEFNGRLFVRQNMGFGPHSDDSYGCYDTYFGFVAQSDGSSKWGTVDHLQIHYHSDGRPDYSRIWIDSPGEDGFIHISDNDSHNYDDPWNFEAVVGKYTHVRDLVSYEGTNVTVAPDPSEIEDVSQPVITEPEPEDLPPDDGQPAEPDNNTPSTPSANSTPNTPTVKAPAPSFVSWVDTGLEDHAMNWGDAVLEELMRRTLSIRGRDIMLSDAWELTELKYTGDAGGRIKSIRALSELKNLTTLELLGNSITDFSPLKELTNLTRLNLSSNDVKGKITPLSGLTNLTYLDLAADQIKDISALSSLTNLTYLRLSYNSIEDVSALSSLTNLTSLELQGNSITDYSSVEFVPELYK